MSCQLKKKKKNVKLYTQKIIDNSHDKFRFVNISYDLCSQNRLSLSETNLLGRINAVCIFLFS